MTSIGEIYFFMKVSKKGVEKGYGYLFQDDHDEPPSLGHHKPSLEKLVKHLLDPHNPLSGITFTDPNYEVGKDTRYKLKIKEDSVELTRRLTETEIIKLQKEITKYAPELVRSYKNPCPF